MFTVGSLFAGIGGFDIGLEKAGMSIEWQVEFDPYCQRVLANRWPHVRRYGDIRAINWATVPRVDVLCGGFPCQDISFAGERSGIDGANSGLWVEYVRAIRALRPRFIIVENVPGLLTNEYMGRVLGDLASCGYDAEWDCLPACAFGAHHERDRVFIVAYIDGEQYEVRTSQDQGPTAKILSSNSNGARELQPQRRIFEERRWARHCSRWTPEPDVVRVVYGVPNGAHRIKCLGNSIVPQVAEEIGHMIMAFSTNQSRL